MSFPCVGDEAAWSRFFDLYAGFVFAISRSKGLTSEDADDIVQGVFSELARKMPTFEYDRTKGKFRSYLLGPTYGGGASGSFCRVRRKHGRGQ